MIEILTAASSSCTMFYGQFPSHHFLPLPPNMHSSAESGRALLSDLMASLPLCSGWRQQQQPQCPIAGGTKSNIDWRLWAEKEMERWFGREIRGNIRATSDYAVLKMEEGERRESLSEPEEPEPTSFQRRPSPSSSANLFAVISNKRKLVSRASFFNGRNKLVRQLRFPKDSWIFKEQLERMGN